MVTVDSIERFWALSWVELRAIDLKELFGPIEGLRYSSLGNPTRAEMNSQRDLRYANHNNQTSFIITPLISISIHKKVYSNHPNLQNPLKHPPLLSYSSSLSASNLPNHSNPVTTLNPILFSNP